MSEVHSRPTNSADSAALVGVGGRNKSDEKKNETSLRSLEDDVANRMGQGVEGRAAAPGHLSTKTTWSSTDVICYRVSEYDKKIGRATHISHPLPPGSGCRKKTTENAAKM